MSKITKKQLQRDINNLATELTNLKIELLEKKVISDEPKPQLKQLDQSIFNGLDEKWRWAAFNTPSNSPILFSVRPHESMYGKWYAVLDCDEYMTLDELEGVYEYADDWQNSLIERSIAKELLEVDLSSELTGSELCKAMLARGDGYVVCLVSNVADSHAIKNREHTTLIEQWVERDGFYNYRSQNWGHAVPANPATNEPLTASEAGF